MSEAVAAIADVREVLRKLRHLSTYAEDGWFDSELCYPMYSRAAAIIQPASILEIGVLLGFGLISFHHGWPQVEKMVGFDNEHDGVGNNMLARCNIVDILGAHGPPDWLIVEDFTSAIREGPYDLIHVDADHTAAGTYRQALIAWATGPRVMLIDDYLSTPSVKAGVEAFAEECGLRFKVWKSLRGWAVFSPELEALPDAL